jgi:transcriptional regulator with XRE-family HTH domain
MARRSLGRILAEAREAVGGISQSDLARASNHSPGFISRLEKAGDVTSIQFATLVSLAIPLGLSLDEIAYLTGLTTVPPGEAGSSHGPTFALLSKELREVRAALESALRRLDDAERKIEALAREPGRKEKVRAQHVGRPLKSKK